MTLREAIAITLDELGGWNGIRLIHWALWNRGRFKNRERARQWPRHEVMTELKAMERHDIVRRNTKGEWRIAP